jgi:hypothetical protein
MIFKYPLPVAASGPFLPAGLSFYSRKAGPGALAAAPPAGIRLRVLPGLRPTVMAGTGMPWHSVALAEDPALAVRARDDSALTSTEVRVRLGGSPGQT